jgi:hypothetical protein
MKFILFTAGIALSYVLGYMTEPLVRLSFTGQNPATAPVIPAPAPTPAEPVVVDLSGLRPEQLPQTITLKAAAEVSDASSGLKMKIEAGNKVKLLRVDGANAIISPGAGPFEGRIAIANTDLVEQMIANPPSAIPPVTAPEPPVVAQPTPDPVPEPEVKPEPEAVAEPETAAVAEPEPTTPPEPEPTTPPEPSPSPAPADSGDPVAIMKESIGTGQIKEFAADQVLSWNKGEDETVDGVTYQTGLVDYKAETIFGEKTIQAKALISNGKVERWIWPKSGMEIK